MITPPSPILTPDQQMPPQPLQAMSIYSGSGNPVLDEIHRAHDNLSPPAKQALSVAAGQSAPAAPTSSLVTPPTPIPTESSRAILPPGVTRPVMRFADDAGQSAPAAGGLVTPPVPIPSAQPTAHQQSLTDLENSPSGIDQIHNKPGRMALKILGAIGQVAAPRIDAAIPGTQGHHQQLSIAHRPLLATIRHSGRRRMNRGCATRRPTKPIRWRTRTGTPSRRMNLRRGKSRIPASRSRNS